MRGAMLLEELRSASMLLRFIEDEICGECEVGECASDEETVEQTGTVADKGNSRSEHGKDEGNVELLPPHEVALRYSGGNAPSDKQTLEAFGGPSGLQLQGGG